MKYRRQNLAIAAAFAVAALALPAAAAAEYYVPPANSAANQYTESVPGAGGESGGKRKKATPGTALGAGNAKKLEAKGPAGKATAELAAETAPPQLVDHGSGGGEATDKSGGDGQTGGKGGSEGNGTGEGESGSAPAGSGGSNGGSSGGNAEKGSGANVQQPQGSSGFGQVFGQATGTSNGNLGLWLPLAIVLTLIGSVAYWVRMRHAQPGHRA
jgi:hypothetical protein